MDCSVLARNTMVGMMFCILGLLAGCRSVASHRQEADADAYRAIEAAQRQALGQTEPFTIEKPSDTLRRRLLLDQQLPTAGKASLGIAELDKPTHWPEPHYPAAATNAATLSSQTLTLSLLDALQVAARNSREYQSAKESLFETALSLDLSQHDFRTQLASGLSASFSSDDNDDTLSSGAEADASRAFPSGIDITAQLGVDLTEILTGDASSSLGLVADASISIPLLRGAGRHIVRENLTQAERDTVYAVYTFEEFKRSFAVDTASAYLAVLRRQDEVDNAKDNQARLALARRRAHALADAGRLPAVELDQAAQDELRARNRQVSAEQAYQRSLDAFKVTLGLPPDARIELDRDELSRLAQGVTPAIMATVTNLDMTVAMALALEERPDMHISAGRVFDAQRGVVIAADALRTELTLLGSAQVGQTRTRTTGTNDTTVTTDTHALSAILNIDLPLDRTAERASYRSSLIALEKAVRNMQAEEDRIKLAVRDKVRALQEASESIAIQRRAVELAERREQSTSLFLEAGRAKMRDVLEAQEAMLSTRNALTAALVDWRVSLLQLQHLMGILRVDDKGLWQEATIETALRKHQTKAGQYGSSHQ